MLAGRSVALIFEKPSTRTRLSFDAGVHELGGHPVVLRGDEMQLSRGESPRDTALVLSRHVSAIGIRTGADAIIEELAAYATVPVINMLTAGHHPCQAYADPSRSGDVRHPRGTQARVRRRWQQRRAEPGRRRRDRWHRGRRRVAARLRARARSRRHPTHRSAEAVAGAHAIYADVWVSMGDEDTADERRAALQPYRIDDALLDLAAPNAIALHCLPAHPGEEITESVLYGDRQRIWDQAENRRHAQKALIELLVD